MAIKKIKIPSGEYEIQDSRISDSGNSGQVLTKTNNGFEWKDPSSAIEVTDKTDDNHLVSEIEIIEDDLTVSVFPEGKVGQVLVSTGTGVKWVDLETLLKYASEKDIQEIFNT